MAKSIENEVSLLQRQIKNFENMEIINDELFEKLQNENEIDNKKWEMKFFVLNGATKGMLWERISSLKAELEMLNENKGK